VVTGSDRPSAVPSGARYEYRKSGCNSRSSHSALKSQSDSFFVGMGTDAGGEEDSRAVRGIARGAWGVAEPKRNSVDECELRGT
jgi:hypothetical protein